ncbi:MAG: GDCCVxC domain-containing (seleno)protein [Saprospiraceae bacterium]|nr:GDCCVxC domain-containing (seleno)protein [Saprospiraceae bacterium]
MTLTKNKSILGGIFAFILATSCCWLPALILALGGSAGLLALSNELESYSGMLMVLAVFLLTYGGYQYYKTKQMKEVVLESTITCPECNHAKTETMPTNACQFFYECENCKKVLKPNQGDCCVFCSFGTVACPPIQEGVNCCD